MMRALMVLLLLATPVWGATLTQLQTFDPNIGALDGIGYDPVNDHLYVVDDTGLVLAYTPAGTQLHSFQIPGAPATGGREWDAELTSVPITLGGTALGANTLLVHNSDDSPEVVYALDKNTGALLGSVALDPAAENLGGVSYHAGTGTLFGIDFVDEAIYELDPNTGAVLNSFAIAPPGSPPYQANFSDVDINPSTGNLYLVSSIPAYSDVVRELTPTGAWVADHDLPVGITQLSGIAFIGNTNEAWLTERDVGEITRVGGFPLSTVPEPSGLLLVGLALLGLGLARRR